MFALVYRETAVKAPVDCDIKQGVLYSQYAMSSDIAIISTYLNITSYRKYLQKRKKKKWRSLLRIHTFKKIFVKNSPASKV